MYRTRRNEDTVDEDVDHEPGKEATYYKAEMVIPNQYSKHIYVPSFVCVVYFVTGDCMMVIG